MSASIITVVVASIDIKVSTVEYRVFVVVPE